MTDSAALLDYSAPLSNATRQIDSLTAALAGRKLDEAKTIVVDLRKRMDQVLAWIDSRPKERPMHITTCTTCGTCYDESSEESANAPDRQCYECYWQAHQPQERTCASSAPTAIETPAS